jgi:hypothetical protein
MNYVDYAPVVLSGIALLWGVVGVLSGKAWVMALAMTGCAGMGFVVATTNYQATGELKALLGAYVFVVVGGLYLKQLRDRPSKRDRKLWRQLFPMNGFWGMIIHDSRRN